MFPFVSLYFPLLLLRYADQLHLVAVRIIEIHRMADMALISSGQARRVAIDAGYYTTAARYFFRLDIRPPSIVSRGCSSAGTAVSSARTVLTAPPNCAVSV